MGLVLQLRIIVSAFLRPPVMEVKVFNALRVQMSGKKSPSLLIDLYIAENSTVLIGFFGRRIHRMLLQQ